MDADVKACDLVVVGAGPAGAAAARRARALGLSVALVDKAVFPRDKLCGALLSGRGHKALKAVFGLAPDSEHFLFSREVAFKWDGETIAEFTAPRDLTYTYRRDFDHRLLREAIASGAEDYQGVRVERFDNAANRVVLDSGEVLEYGVLVGADGAASPVARHLFGRAFDPATIGFAFEVEAPVPCTDGAPMSIDFRIVDWGYGWNFPKKHSRTIGLGAIKAVDQDLMGRMKRYMAREGAGPEGLKIKGAHIPFGDFRRVPGRGNVLLAGDAAGLVDPVTGEGLAYAMESGAGAAEAAAEALAAGEKARALGIYRKRIGHIHAELDRANRLRRFQFSGAFAGVFREKLASSENLRSAFFALLAGEASYAEIEKLVSKQMLARITGGVSGWPARLAGRLRR